ncbi:transposase (ISH1) [Natrialba magadii ATCC 43099]|uniref:Transposase (ISH1) n=1 Tax=Natrialba magadii (strain ATCC 43099 / DSM 3394 / CCM 3739 / CIP 104546 / IAM 13178 / JCM 8861 / NBRC 102185 / NCIMB 2190 / MS3) TaxID=547559 RepID=L9UZI7_NATMM|nr:transposase (ISH1) [Natrialba magadii ATCC 43099]
MQIALILDRVELEKSLRETEDYLNEMPGILAVFDLNEAPHYSSFCRWEQEYRMRELRRLLPSPDVSGRGIAGVIDMRMLATIVLTVQQTP